MQRTGRKGYATFRIVVQDSRFTPTSGRIVESIGHYNPHTKETVIDVEKAEKHLANGAQPSPRVVKILIAQKAKMPAWVEVPTTAKKGKVKNAEKLRKNQPKEEVEEVAVPEEVSAPEPAQEAVEVTEAPVEEKVEAAEEKTEEVAEETEKPAEA